MQFAPLWHSVVLLRFPFSVLLLPVFLLALSQAPCASLSGLIWSGLILHLLIYPASNGYNSFIDRDTEAIGGLAAPPPVPEDLGKLTLVMDLLALGLAYYLEPVFAIGCAILILLSRAYSAPWPRLKRYPWISFLLVAGFQGAGAFIVSLLGFVPAPQWPELWHLDFGLLALASSLLVGGSYPLSQIYQHESDKERGDQTLSLQLGIMGTLVFAALMFASSGLIFSLILPVWQLLLLGACLSPSALYFGYWCWQIRRDTAAANFSHTMRMNLLAALGSGLAFALISYQNWLHCL